MNILYLTMTRFGDGSGHNVHLDLMRKFRQEGHEVYVVFPIERGLALTPSGNVETHGRASSWRKVKGGMLLEYDRMHILAVRTLRLQKANIVEKGIGQLMVGRLYQRAFERCFGRVKFDLITYSTPPITLVGMVKWAKKRNPQAMTYLQLKDIFPQNAVDMGMLSTHGIKGILYRRFRRMECELYGVSDWIGCMSPANVRYLVEHNPNVCPDRVEICPNSMEVPVCRDAPAHVSMGVRQKYGLPEDRPLILYGGNLGKPQGIPFLIECLKANCERDDCHFVIVGNGVDYPLLEQWCATSHPLNVTLLQRLPIADYDELVASCDVGLIFLDYRFTIPNYPSRLLNCLLAHKPVIACTDPNCDTGTIAESNGYGFYCPSNSVNHFTQTLDRMLRSDIKAMGERGYQFFLENYTVECSYGAIMRHLL